MVSDAGFATAYRGNSQGASFHEELQKGMRVPSSLISWKSNKVVNSTLAAETQSLSKGLGELCWIVSIFNERTDPEFELRCNKVVAIAKEETDHQLKESLMIVDAKTLFDNLSQESAGPSQDKRTCLELQLVRQNIGLLIRACPLTA